MRSVTSDHRLDHDGLVTFLTEVEAILNSRPLTKESSDVNDLRCLTPNQLLQCKAQSLPPGTFPETDNYVQRRWRQVQYISDLFCSVLEKMD